MLDDFLQHRLALRAKDTIENKNLFEELKELLVRVTGKDGGSRNHTADEILQQSLYSFGGSACLSFEENYKYLMYAYEDFYVEHNVKVIGMQEFIDIINTNKENIKEENVKEWVALL